MEKEKKEQEVECGDIYYTSWGYDQTNYDYIQIIKISKSGKSCICKRTSHDDKGRTETCYIQKPNNKTFGDEFRMRIQSFHNQITLRGSYPFCHSAKRESMRLDTFFKAKENQTFYETDSRFGH